MASSAKHVSRDMKPEAGLAEWTSKIKAMQQQVDADEEAEQRRLADEIAASRLARLRRSRGGQSSRPCSVDLSRPSDDETSSFKTHSDVSSSGQSRRTTERPSDRSEAYQAVNTIPSDFTPRTPPLRPVKSKENIGSLNHSGSRDAKISGVAKRIVERPSYQEETYQRSSGKPMSPNSGSMQPLRPAKSTENLGAPKTSGSRVPPDSKTQPVSLAQFMGGRASGPRLNKHAPQPDAQDHMLPQGTLPRAPHPTFGTGGVAMPGMAGLPKVTSRLNGRGPELPVAPFVSPKFQEAELATFPRPNLRARTLSTPSPSVSSPSIGRGHRPISPLPPTPTSTSPFPKASSNTDTPFRGVGDRSTGAPRRSADRPPSPAKPSTPPSLSRPILPDPRPPSGPQISLSHTPSKAFLRPPSQKEVTPSISRLQGRGFVRNMVKISAQLESQPEQVANETPKEPEKVQNPGTRRPTVLDRWQPNVSPKIASSSPPPSPTRPPRRKSVVFEPPVKVEDIQESRLVKQRKPSKGILKSPPLPDVGARSVSTASAISTDSTGLGSATTVHVYKPIPVPAPNVDELGFNMGRKPSMEFPVPSKNPLSHPTKERARKPRKVKMTGTPQSGGDSTSPPVQVPPQAPQPKPIIEPTSRRPLPPRPILPYKRESPDNTPSPQHLEKASGNRPPILAQYEPSAMRTEAPSPYSIIEPSKSNLRQVTPEGTDRLPLVVGPEPNQIPESRTNLKPHQAASASAPLPTTRPQQEEVKVQPPKHSRRPTTGNRATVMDVAQALSELEQIVNGAESSGQSDSDSKPSPSTTTQIPPPPPPIHRERPKSTYIEKYASIRLPTLKEEQTPVPSPPATLSGGFRKDVQAPGPDTPPPTVPAPETSQSFEVNIHSLNRSGRVPPVGDLPEQHIPRVLNIDALVERRTISSQPDSDLATISVEVMSVTGSTASMLPQDQAIFHDTEVLAIVHRSKSRSSGLVWTRVWGWQGKRATIGDKEERKLQELGKRYGTSTNIVRQSSEPPQLIHALGGTLVIRQGPRSHWTPENTTMHLIRSQGRNVFVDEQDLSIRNLCSAFSYCISILSSIYVWYGRGSIEQERKAALEYGRNLAGDNTPIELYEGEESNDEMFWMILGDEDYANADYWRWRSRSSTIDPLIWRIEAEASGNGNLSPVISFMNETSWHDFVYIIDCIWEVYVMAGRNARANKRDIESAIRAASELSARVSPRRPYRPTVHVLLFPSQLPRDLLLNFRDLDEDALNDGQIPDHMNLLPSAEALAHLWTPVWDVIPS